jgi:hypothetical protein
VVVSGTLIADSDISEALGEAAVGDNDNTIVAYLQCSAAAVSALLPTLTNS